MDKLWKIVHTYLDYSDIFSIILSPSCTFSAPDEIISSLQNSSILFQPLCLFHTKVKLLFDNCVFIPAKSVLSFVCLWNPLWFFRWGKAPVCDICLKLSWDLIWLSLPGSFCEIVSENACWDCWEQQKFQERKIQKCSWGVGAKSGAEKFSLIFSYFQTSSPLSAMCNLQIGLLFYIAFHRRNLHCQIVAYIYSEVEIKPGTE